MFITVLCLYVFYYVLVLRIQVKIMFYIAQLAEHWASIRRFHPHRGQAYVSISLADVDVVS